MTKPPPAHVLIAGVTTRALAISAASAGYRVTALDAFGDLDLRQAARVVALRDGRGTEFSPLTAANAAQRIEADLVTYTSNFENYPDAVLLLAHRGRLLGNSPDVLVRVRDPIELTRALRRRGLITPRTRVTPAGGARGTGSWLLKPRRSGGGHGITTWRPGRPVPRKSYLQERIVGKPGSIIFAADGRHAVPLGLTRQLVADPCFGAQEFRYCGSLIGTAGAGLFPMQDRLMQTATALAAAVTDEFGLVGLNGLDFVARNGTPYPTEVNPRYSASMELLERAHYLSVFETHLRACNGILPIPSGSVSGVHGKAVVFARRDVALGGTRRWLDSGWVADIPHPGEQIRSGRPICTIFAQGRDARSCYQLLVERAATVHHSAEHQRMGAA